MANGNFGGGDGLIKPFLVEDSLDFMALSAKSAENNRFSFLQTTDIDMSGKDFVEIGTLYGTYDGGGHKVTNLKKTNSVFFCSSNYGTIKNLELGEGCTWDFDAGPGQTTRGPFAVRCLNGSYIVNCINRTNISGRGSNGQQSYCGISGIARDANIINCKNYGNINSIFNAAGIAAGTDLPSSGSIIGCANYGSINADAFASGIALSFTGVTSSNMYGQVEDCANYGTIRGRQAASGISVNYGPLVKNCINYGIIKSAITASGIFTSNLATKEYTIKNCFSLGSAIHILANASVGAESKFNRVAYMSYKTPAHEVSECYALDTMVLIHD